jgi:hypothetical protein
MESPHDLPRSPPSLKGNRREKSDSDFIGRFETLERDLRHALGQVGLKLDKDLPRVKATFRPLPYRDYYDGDTITIVGDWYKREIDLLGYAF